MKNKPRWLRYGIYIAISYPIAQYLLIFLASLAEKESSIIATILFFPILFLALPSVITHELLRLDGEIFAVISYVITGFLIGVIAGYVVEKFKQPHKIQR